MSKAWNELTQEEKNDILKKLDSSVKVKLNDERIFEFNPFKECASLPPQYNLVWLPKYDFEKPKREFMFCDQVFIMVATHAIETNNIEYLKECNFETKNLKFNSNL